MDVSVVEERVAKDRQTALEKRDVWEMFFAALKEQDDREVSVHLWLFPMKVKRRVLMPTCAVLRRKWRPRAT